MSALFPTQSETIARFAAGLYGVAVGAPTNTAVLAQANVFGLNQILNSYYDGSFSSLPTVAVAATIINNVGIVAGRSGLTASHVAEAVAFVKAQLDQAAKTNTEGETIASILTSFSNMSADNVFGAAARAWNTTISNNIAYTASGAIADIAMAQATVPVATPVTYSIEADKSTVAEGGSVTYTISTTGVEPGTSLAYIVSGTGNALASTQAGVVTINKEGKGTITIPTLDNAVRGDAGSLALKLISGNQTLVSATNVTVTDNEPDPVIIPVTYTVTSDKSSIEEGESVTYTITTTGIEPGTSIAYIVRGTGNAAASVQDGSVTIDKEGKAYVTIPTLDNALFGDSGTLSFKLITGNQTLETATTVIVDDNEPTPVNPSITVTGAKAFTVDGDVTEGDIVAFTVSTTGYGTGTVLTYHITGVANGSTASIADSPAGTTSGALTVGVNGKAVVYVQTAKNTTYGDAGSLTLTVQNGIGGSVTSEAVIIADDDSNNDTYTLTPAANSIIDTNGGDDTFLATVGGIYPTLTSGDKLDGGEGYDTLRIEVMGNNPVYSYEGKGGFDFDPNGLPIKNIEHVIIDVSRNSSGEDVVDSSYFDDIVEISDGEYSTGSLEKLTIVAASESFFGTSQIPPSIRIHKDMELELVGSGVAGNSVSPNSGVSQIDSIILDEDVTNLTVTLDGVGAAGEDGPSIEDGSFVLNFDSDSETSALETLTIRGDLAGSYGDKSTALLYLATDGEDQFSALEEITISLNKALLRDPLNEVVLNDVKTVKVGFDSDIVKTLNKIDFSGSDANIVTRIERSDIETTPLAITLGQGSDMLDFVVDKSTDSNVLTTIDLSSGGNDQINIVNSLELTGNIGMRANLPFNMSKEQDLLEDVITIKGLDFNGTGSDALVLNLAISNEAGRLVANVSNTSFYKAVTGSPASFSDALEQVAGFNDGDNEIVVFEWDGNTYVYADTEDGEDFDGDLLIRVEGTKGANQWLNSSVLLGGEDDDILIGGSGADVMTGGLGEDVFVIASATDSTEAYMDTITDFSMQVGTQSSAGPSTDADDIIDISSIANGITSSEFFFNSSFPALAGFAAVKAAAEAAFDGDSFYAFGGSTATDSYLFLDQDKDGTFDATDTVVKLAGVSNFGLQNFDWININVGAAPI